MQLKEVLFTVETDTIVTNQHISVFETLIKSYGYTIRDKVITYFDEESITCVFILSESHFILHTYHKELKQVMFNLFTCKIDTPEHFKEIAETCADILKGKLILIDIIDRSNNAH